jgi:LysR family transcriptional regulator, transcriptional activator for bauABCD operon
LKTQTPDLKLLSIFRAIVANGGFSGAQSEVNLGQPAISECLKALELRVGAGLCQRGPAGFKLLPAGEMVFRASERLFHALHQFDAEVASIKGGLYGNLSIGVMEHLITNPDARFENTIDKFKARRGNSARLAFVIENASNLQRDLAQGRLDIIIGVQAPSRLEGFSYKFLMYERLGLFVGKNHPLFHQSTEVTLSDLFNHSYVTSGVIEPSYFSHPALSPDPNTVAIGTIAHIALALSGHYLAYIPLHVAEPFESKGLLKQVRADVMTREHTVFAVTRKTSERNALIRAFVDDLIDCHRHVRKRLKRNAQTNTPLAAKFIRPAGKPNGARARRTGRNGSALGR